VNSVSNEAVSIIQILANLHEFVREPTLRKKLTEFYEFNDSEMRQTIFLALNAVSSIEPEKLTAVVTTWMKVLSEFDTPKIVLMLRLYCEEIYRDPQIINKLNIGSLIGAFLALNDSKREKFIICFKEAMLTLPNANKFIQRIPGVALNVLKIS
jgi:hypothetical protein